VAVYHVLADGSRPADITGHIVRVEDAGVLYNIIHKINERLNKENIHSKNEVKRYA
jgi:hypothetical protein